MTFPLFFSLKDDWVVNTFIFIIGNIADKSNADVTTDEYHLYKVLDLINSEIPDCNPEANNHLFFLGCYTGRYRLNETVEF